MLATDLALVVTQRLRALGVAGDFVEFFGPGVATLSRRRALRSSPTWRPSTARRPASSRSTRSTLAYLRETGRSADASASSSRRYARRNGLWFDPEARPALHAARIEIDLATIGMHVAGPRRPQDLLRLRRGAARCWPTSASRRGAAHASLPRHPVAIAAITSCTNTSDPALLIAAGLVARKARALGLARAALGQDLARRRARPPPLAYLRARRASLDDLAALGFDIVGFGCTHLHRQLRPADRRRSARRRRKARAKAGGVLSGNRNFPGRVHPDLDLGFIMSPPLVIAFALAGDAERDLSREPVQTGADGAPVILRDLWPTTRGGRRRTSQRARDPADYARDFARAEPQSALARARGAGHAALPVGPGSTALRRPPFASADEGSQLGRYGAYPLLVVGDDVTTDHISPASAIPPDSLVADFLVERGDEPQRPQRLRLAPRQLGGDDAGGLPQPVAREPARAGRAGRPHAARAERRDRCRSGRRRSATARRGEPVVLVAGERYGTGSSRDWAAKGQRLLGIRAVLASSFERIHRSNLIGMGILPLRLPAGPGAAAARAAPRRPPRDRGAGRSGWRRARRCR